MEDRDSNTNRNTRDREKQITKHTETEPNLHRERWDTGNRKRDNQINSQRDTETERIISTERTKHTETEPNLHRERWETGDRGNLRICREWEKMNNIFIWSALLI